MLTHPAAYGASAIATLGTLVAEAKGGNALAPVTIIVRDNIAAITVRRALARGVGERRGVAAITVTTLRRLAEQILAAAARTAPPVTSTLLTILWRHQLAVDPGCFGPVAEHPATVRALVRAHRELRGADAAALNAIAASGRLGADLVRLHHAVTARALAGRRDEAAVLQDATALVTADASWLAEFGAIIAHLPDEPSPLERAFLTALDEQCGLTALIGQTGDPALDAPIHATFGHEDAQQQASTPVATRVFHASDADDEVRAIVREVRALLADGTPAHRIAVLHTIPLPYARLVHDHLAAAGITANGPGVRSLRDRAVADAFLTLLALDPDDLQRVAFFDWLGRAPIRHGDGAGTVPRTQWERLSREAGITGGDWGARLADHEARHRSRLEADRDTASAGSIAYRERAIAEMRELAAFVAELQELLREGQSLRDWAALGDWALGLFRRYLGSARLPEEEQRAATAIETTLGALAELDGLRESPTLGESPTLAGLAEILDIDLDARRPRAGRFGDGVFVGPVSSALSLEVSHVFIAGLSEDQFPGRHRPDPLLNESVRAATAGALLTARDRLRQQHRALLAAFAAGDVVTASFPRGDLRRGAERLPSRWLMPTLRALTGNPGLEATRWAEASGPHMSSVASHWEAITRADRPGTEQEWRLRRLAGGERLPADVAAEASVDLIAARRSIRFTRYDGNLEGIAGLPDFTDGASAIAPTVLEGYAGCPHTYFVEHLLGVSPLEAPEEIIAIRPMDLGSIVHEVLDRLVKASAHDLPGYGEPWSAEHRQRMRHIAEEVMSDFERRGLTGHPRLWERERVVLLDDLEAILDLDDEAHRANDSRILASELVFGMRDAPPVLIHVGTGAVAMRGSADRVDETRDGRLIVTDFKTGRMRGFTDIGNDSVVAGTKLQLPLYAHAARAAFSRDRVTAGYWFIGRRDRGRRIDLPLDDALESTYAAALETLTDGIRDGRFIARPPDEDDFLWVRCAFCNPDGVGYGHVRVASERKRTDPVLASLFSLLDPSVVDPSAVPAEEAGDDAHR
ncbi:PD-(D/E)XK nuclease family protein [Agromyces sp. NPDC049794]|uniref:PD-(D/E)XK nuclease family protein n=1 Tax=unclassified Agromyces TaxID=2639701 RepID=UPI0033E0C2F7